MSTMIILISSSSNEPPRIYDLANGLLNDGVRDLVKKILAVLFEQWNALPLPTLSHPRPPAYLEIVLPGGLEEPVIRLLDDNRNPLAPPIKISGEDLQPANAPDPILEEIHVDQVDRAPRSEASGEPHGPPPQATESKLNLIVYCKPNALKDAWEHAREHPNREVGGVIVGRVRRGRDGHSLFVLIEETVRGTDAIEENARLTFTADTWKRLNEEIDQRWKDPERKEYWMVGWYHTHPGYGIFLSEHDLFWHRSYFGNPWHLAWVIDPHSGTDGFFGWAETEIVRLPRPELATEEFLEKFDKLDNKDEQTSSPATSTPNPEEPNLLSSPLVSASQFKTEATGPSNEETASSRESEA